MWQRCSAAQRPSVSCRPAGAGEREGVSLRRGGLLADRWCSFRSVPTVCRPALALAGLCTLGVGGFRVSSSPGGRVPWQPSTCGRTTFLGDTFGSQNVEEHAFNIRRGASVLFCRGGLFRLPTGGNSVAFLDKLASGRFVVGSAVGSTRIRAICVGPVIGEKRKLSLAWAAVRRGAARCIHPGFLRLPPGPQFPFDSVAVGPVNQAPIDAKTYCGGLAAVRCGPVPAIAVIDQDTSRGETGKESEHLTRCSTKSTSEVIGSLRIRSGVSVGVPCQVSKAGTQRE